MKNYICTGLLLAVCTLPCLLSAQPARRALLIAVGEYAPATRWPSLASGRDAGLLRDVLVRQGFPEANIRVLRDSAATRAGIDEALRAFTAQVQPGDAVLIHFSGHGQQVADDNRDEADGYDEALVPYDSPFDFQKGKYEGERLLRDDALGQHVRALRARLGPDGSVLVLLDACHSGTGLRGEARAGLRGTDQPMADAKYRKAHRGLADERNTLFGVEDPEKTPAGAPVTAFFAASAHEDNYEIRDESGQKVGSLTYAFCKAFAAAQPSTTYRGLFDRIKTTINSRITLQNPQAEGALDRQVFGGRIAGRPPHFEVKSVADPRTVLLAAGLLSGLSEGAELAFYPIDTRDTIRVNPLAFGTVQSVGALECVVALKQAVVPRTFNGSWAFLRTRPWKAEPLRVQVDLPEGVLADSVRAALRRWPRVELVEKEGGFLVTVCAGGLKNLCLNARGQSAERIIPSQPGQAGAAVMEVLSDMAMAGFLRGLALEDDALRARLDLIPRGAPTDTVSATLQFRVYRDTVALQVTNTGSAGCYYTLVDIQPDGRINVALPEPGRTAADYFLQPGTTHRFDFSWFAPPAGTEVFKLIASRQPLDLRPLVETRGARARGLPQPNLMEFLIAQGYDTSGRDALRSAAYPGQGGFSVTTLTVQIRP